MAPVIAEQGAVPPAGLAAAEAALCSPAPAPRGASASSPTGCSPGAPARQRPPLRSAPGIDPGPPGPLGLGCPLIPTPLPHPVFTSPCAPLWRGYWKRPTCRFTRFLSCRCPWHPTCPDQGTVELCLHSALVMRSLLPHFRVHFQIAQTFLEYVFQQ